MSTRVVSKNRRIIIDYGQNQELGSKLEFLEEYYAGLSKAEITKLAIIELFRKQTTPNLPTINLTEAEEKSLKNAMKDKVYVKIPDKTSLSEFVKNNDF